MYPGKAQKDTNPKHFSGLGRLYAVTAKPLSNAKLGYRMKLVTNIKAFLKHSYVGWKNMRYN